jgi:hypothetical protein
MGALLRAFFAILDYESPSERGLKLLRANLTPAQLEQHDQFRYFDVIGCHTGHRYRIHHGDAMNIDEFDASGTCINRWCFLPKGGLTRGDVLLAQKLALELFELDARAIANNYHTHIPQRSGRLIASR